MKYIKTFEELNKKAVDHNKVYAVCYYSKSKLLWIGKFNLSYIFEGYLYTSNIKRILKEYFIIKGDDWKGVREATPEEIEFYELATNIEKYNL